MVFRVGNRSSTGRSKIQRFWNRNPAGTTVALVCVAAALTITLLVHQYRQARESLISRELAGQEVAWTAVQRLLDRRATTWFEVVVDQPRISDIMARAQDAQLRDQARADLVDYLAPLTGAMASAGAELVHFHLPEGLSFYRSHQPDRFGDTVIAHRPVLQQVNERLVPVAGIEAGRLAIAYRNAYPLLDSEGTLLGSVEISVPLSNILPELVSLRSGREHELVLRRDAEALDRWSEATARDDWFGADELFTEQAFGEDSRIDLGASAQAVAARLAQNSSHRQQLLTLERGAITLRAEGQRFLVLHQSVLDAGGQAIGVLLSYAPEPGLTRLARNLILNVLLAVSVLALLGLGTYRLIGAQAEKHEQRRRLQKAHEDELFRIAYYDALTGLPNRLLLTNRLQRAMEKARADEGLLAVAMLDMDAFKRVNDRFGAEIGDQLLIEASRRMRQHLPDGVLLGRVGGDEFAFVLTDLGSVDESEQIAGGLLRAFDKPLAVGEAKLQLSISASMGLSFYPQETELDGDQLLRQASRAMYRAKLTGGNHYELFDVDREVSQRERLRFVAEVAEAIAANELRLYYQPKVNLRSGEVLGMEALIRWQHPSRGLLGPGAFLPWIEHHPVEMDVGRWVLRQALLQARAWQAQGLVLTTAVNIAGDHLQHPDFVPELAALMDEFADLAPGRVSLEVVETSALEDIQRVGEVIAACRALGVDFELDDFGTGYSSLTYLKGLPVAGLKIDQSFVREMSEHPDDLAILEGVLSMAQLAAWATGDCDQPPVLDPTECLFSRPLAAGSLLPEASIADEIHHVHDQIHRLGERIVTRRRADAEADCAADFEQVERTRDRLLELLDRALEAPA